MERIKALIDKLYAQKNSGAGAAQLLVTVQLLQVELLEAEKTPQPAGKGRISVVFPFKAKFTGTPPAAVEEINDPDKVVYALEEEPQERLLKEDDEPLFYPAAEAEEKPAVLAQPTAESPQEKVKAPAPVVAQPLPAEQAPKGYVLRKPAVAEAPSFQPAAEAAVQTAPEKTAEPAPAAAQPPAAQATEEYHHFDAVMETPTLAQHQPPKEVHQLIVNDTPSLNDKLKQEGPEIAHRLTATPIKDLRKGIGINDRFTFVNTLFRGDDAMYERSIKTINNFGALAEAEYWISRELKYKLGWSESSETVQHFYSLVKRRFA